MQTRRTEYWSHPRPSSLQLTLHVPDSQPLEGDVVDLSGRGLGAVVFGAREQPVGLDVEIALHALVLRRPIRARARLRSCERLEHGLRCGLEFLDPERVEAQIPFVLRQEFNRRRWRRVELPEPVAASVRPDGCDESEACTAVLIDVSCGGAHVMLRSPVAGPDWRRVRVRFALPGDAERELVATVRAWNEAALHLSFDASATAHFERHRAAIESFVTAWLRRGGAGATT